MRSMFPLLGNQSLNVINYISSKRNITAFATENINASTVLGNISTNEKLLL